MVECLWFGLKIGVGISAALVVVVTSLAFTIAFLDDYFS